MRPPAGGNSDIFDWIEVPMKLTIRKANEKLAVELPDQMIACLGWRSGDVLEAQIVGDALKLVRVEGFESTMKIADEVMGEYSGTLAQLAKS